MDPTDKRIDVIYVETGAKRSIPREAFDPRVHRIALEAPEPRRNRALVERGPA